jgi:hypothetical protein
VLFYLVALYRARYLYGTAEQQQLLGKGGLTGIGVGNDGEGPAPGNFFFVFHATKNQLYGFPLAGKWLQSSENLGSYPYIYPQMWKLKGEKPTYVPWQDITFAGYKQRALCHS